MSEFRYSGTGEVVNSGAIAAIVQASLRAQLVGQGLAISYCVVTQTSGGITATGRYVVSLGVISNDNQTNVTAKVKTALSRVFSNNDIDFTGQFGSNTSNTVTNNTGGGTYTVQSGDTLSKIGAKLGINWQTLASLNGINSPYVIRVGQVLKTGGNGATQTPQVIPQPVITGVTNNGQITTTNQNVVAPVNKNFFEKFADDLKISATVLGIGAAAVLLIVLVPKK